MKHKQLYIEMNAGGTPVIKVIGDIHDWTAEWFRQAIQELEERGVATALVYMSSPGGSVMAAWDMFNAIQESSVIFKCRVGSMCASAATLVLCAFGDMAEGVNNGMYMIHQPSSYGGGTEKELRAEADLLAKIKPAILRAYSEKMGQPEKAVEDLWADGDYWMTAQDAKKMGLISKVVKPDAKLEMVTTQDVDDLGKEYEIPSSVVMSAKGFLEAGKSKQSNSNSDMKQLKMMASMLAIANPKFDKNTEEESAVIAEMQAQANEILTLRNSNKTLKTENEDLKNAAEQVELSARTKVLDQKIESGAFAKETRESMLEMAKVAPEAFDKVMETAAAHVPISMQINGKGKAVSADMKIGDKPIDECSYMDLSKDPKGQKVIMQLTESEPELVSKMKSNPNTPKSELV